MSLECSQKYSGKTGGCLLFERKSGTHSLFIWWFFSNISQQNTEKRVTENEQGCDAICSETKCGTRLRLTRLAMDQGYCNSLQNGLDIFHGKFCWFKIMKISLIIEYLSVKCNNVMLHRDGWITQVLAGTHNDFMGSQVAPAPSEKNFIPRLRFRYLIHRIRKPSHVMTS